MTHFAGLTFMMAAAGLEAFEDRKARAAEILAEPTSWAAIMAETLNFVHHLAGKSWDFAKSTQFGWHVITHQGVTPEPYMYAAWFHFTPKAEGGFSLSAHSHGDMYLLKETRIDVGVQDDGRFALATRDKSGAAVETHTLSQGDDVLAQLGAWLSRNFPAQTLEQFRVQAPKIAGMKDFKDRVTTADFFGRYHPRNPQSPARQAPRDQLTAQ